MVRGRPSESGPLSASSLREVLRTDACDDLGERGVVGRELDPLARGGGRLGHAHAGQVLEPTHVALHIGDAADHVDRGVVGRTPSR